MALDPQKTPPSHYCDSQPFCEVGYCFSVKYLIISLFEIWHFYIKVWASTRKCVSPQWQKWKNLFGFSATFLVLYKSRSWKIGSLWSILTLGELCITSNEGENKVSKIYFRFFKWNFMEIWNVFLFQQAKTTSKNKFWYK